MQKKFKIDFANSKKWFVDFANNPKICVVYKNAKKTIKFRNTLKRKKKYYKIISYNLLNNKSCSLNIAKKSNFNKKYLLYMQQNNINLLNKAIIDKKMEK